MTGVDETREMVGDDARSVAVCVIVPSGNWDLAPLVQAIRSADADQSIVAVWGGDPHLRPVLPAALGVVWCDLGLPESTGVGWNRLLVAMSPRVYEWARAASAVRRMLDDGVASVLVVRAGSVAVVGDSTTDLRERTSAITLLARTSDALPADGRAPTERDLISLGRHSTAVAAFAGGAQPALQWLAERLVDAGEHVGPWFDRLSDLFGSDDFPPSRAAAAGWSTATDGDEASLDSCSILDLDHVDREEPWRFSFGSTPSRVRMSGHRKLADVVSAGWQQCVGSHAELTLPSGIPVAGPVRSMMRASLELWRDGNGELPPEPFGRSNSIFVDWLERPEPGGADIGKIWLAWRDQRPDLQAAFPEPRAGDAGRLFEWATNSWRLERGPVVLRGNAASTFADPQPSNPAHTIVSTGYDRSGVNVLGYLDFDQSLGHIARQIVADLRLAGVPVAAINHHRTNAYRRPEVVAAERVARYATNLVVVNADQFPFVVAHHGRSLMRDRRNIAYWFWELEEIPSSMVKAIDHVDEIWTGSTFIADAFRTVTDKGVRCVPLPVPQPTPSARDRESLGIPADRFVFLVTFDQFSVQERKNPFGAIAAFSRAFAEDEGPLLLIKTINGTKGWRNHERLLLAASHRADIVVWDEHLTYDDQMAVMRASDCLVSLHRSEGLGLHCAEAMWLGKPVIATRYSGNLDFMDDSNAALVGYDLVPVRHGEGIYPETAVWADPDLDEAAAWMRRLVEEPGLADRIGGLARARMTAQTSAAETGRMMARLACLEPTEG